MHACKQVVHGLSCCAAWQLSCMFHPVRGMCFVREFIKLMSSLGISIQDG